MIIELGTTVVIAFFVGSALFRTYRTLKAQRVVDAFAMDESFATHVPSWDEGTETIDPDVASQGSNWSDYWFHDEDGHDEEVDITAGEHLV